MQKAEIYPIKRVDPLSDCSLLTAGDTTSSNKNLLIQRIELLQLQNTELRKREKYLKMVNASLLKALGEKEYQNNIIDRYTLDSFSNHDYDNPEIDHSNKMNSFKKKSKQRKLNLEQAHRRSVETIYQPGEIDPDLSSKKFEVFDNDHYQTFREEQSHRQKQRERRNIISKQKQTFSKTKSPSFFKNKQCDETFKNKCYTPKVQNKKLVSYQNITRKSVNNLMEPLQLQTSFSKKDIYLSCSSRSQKSPISSSSHARLNLNKNIATGLLCDLCGLSYSPVEFMSHAKQCQENHQTDDRQLIKITDKSYQQDGSEEDNQDLLSTLERQKVALLSQINKLKKSRNSPNKKLEQQNLDQIVFIINKKTSSDKNMNNLLKQKNKATSVLKNKKRDRI